MKISIKKPCQENFEEFSPTQAGGFCQSCQKEVIDFSQMTDAQVLNYFSQNQGKSCGRFQQSQLKSYPDMLSPKKNWNAKLMSASILSISLFASLPFTKSHAQSNQVPSAIYLDQDEKQDPKAEEQEVKREGLLVEGIVKDDEGLPLVGVVVAVKNSDRGVLTNEEGKFSLDSLKPGDELVFSYIGYEKKNYLVPDKIPQNLVINLDIKLFADVCIVVGEVAVEKAFISKPSFWQRVKRTFR